MKMMRRDMAPAGCGAANGAATPFPKRGRPAEASPASAGDLAAGGLGELPHHTVALELGQVIDEENAVEMVNLVLQAGGEQPVRLDLLLLAIEVEIAHPHTGRPLHFL